MQAQIPRTVMRFEGDCIIDENWDVYGATMTNSKADFKKTCLELFDESIVAPALTNAFTKQPEWTAKLKAAREQVPQSTERESEVEPASAASSSKGVSGVSGSGAKLPQTIVKEGSQRSRAIYFRGLDPRGAPIQA